MFRGFLFVLGAAIVVCAAMYFVTGRTRYLAWSRSLLLAGLGTGVVFFVILLLKRLI
jgi:hypothetical protein